MAPLKQQGQRSFRRVTGTAALALMLSISPAAKAAPANSLAELYAALGECVRAAAGAPGSEITVVFSLKRNGSLLGKPRISHAKLLGDANARRDFVASVLSGFNHCLPVAMTDGLGGAVAGRPLNFRVISHPHETKV
jgi:hypothetical protein